MKVRIVFSLVVFLLAMLFVPITNLVRHAPFNESTLKQSSLVDFFFNVDFLEGLLNRFLVGFGFSSDPEQAVIGKDGWIFLGDEHLHVMSETRGVREINIDLATRVHLARQAWDKRIKSQGGLGFYVMIVPNAHSVYMEKLPEWAVGAEPRKMVSALLEGGGQDPTLIDLYGPMLKAKAEAPYDVYYKTDTHWNDLGAWYGYKAMAEAIGRSSPQIKWLTDKSIVIAGEVEREGGDLARFLRLTDYLTDHEVNIEVTPRIEVYRSELHGGEQLPGIDNIKISAPKTPLLVRSKNALNDMRVLWLRDSFGEAMSPYMATTFSTVVQQNFHAVLGDPVAFQRLLDEVAPELVIITVVERQSFLDFFANIPPVLVKSGVREFLKASYGIASQTTLHQLSLANGKLFEVMGADPFVVVPLSSTIDGQNNTLLGFDFSCEEASNPKHSIQIFWHDKSQPGFSEENSARFDASAGYVVVDLAISESWQKSRKIQSIRFDLESSSCKKLSFENISLGRNN